MTANNDSNEESTVRLTRRRILAGATVTGIAAAGVGAGTFALFSDNETSSGNTVQAGTLDLQLDGSDGTTGSFTFSGLKPDGNTHQGTVNISNAGSIDGDHVELRFNYTENEADGPGGNNGGDSAPSDATGFATLLEVTTLDYAGNDLLSGVTDDNGNGFVDLDDVASDDVFDSLAAPAGGTNTLTMDLRFISTDSGTYSGSEEDDDFQGDEVSISIDAGLAQQSGQSVL